MEDFAGFGSLFIACIELVLLINVLIFGEKNEVNKTAIRLILLLLMYQLIEFIICYLGANSQAVIYSAFAVITFLPPLGLYLVLQFYEMDFKWTPVIYLPALFFVVYYPLLLEEFFVTKCTVLYAIYNYPLGYIYGIIYYIPILATLIILAVRHKGLKTKLKKKLSLSLMFGFYLTFVPAFTARMLFEEYRTAIESLMCKQAVILALAVAYFIITNRTEKEEKVEQSGNNT